MKFLLDTSVIIDCLRGRHNRPAILRKFCLAGNTIGCCAINIAEIWTGARHDERIATAEFLNGLEYFEISREAAELGGEMKQRYSRQGITLSLTDTLVSAVAITHQLTLVTDNPKHFPMPELNMYRLE